tara:strand:+ start:158 stop:520 length:363 start_codon:yes stop_codon:yes gene_type:complete
MAALGNDRTMPKYTVMIFTRAHKGREAEFDQWYEDTHVDDVLATAPGWTSGQRFNLVHQAGLEMPSPHLALYEADGESPQTVLRTLNETRHNREISDSMDASDFAMWVFDEAGQRHTLNV